MIGYTTTNVRWFCRKNWGYLKWEIMKIIGVLGYSRHSQFQHTPLSRHTCLWLVAATCALDQLVLGDLH